MEAAIVTGISVGASLYQVDQQKQASQAQSDAANKARGIDQRTASIGNQREKRKAIAANRIEKAMLINQASSSGTMGSSGTAGSIASSNANLAGSVGFQRTQLAGSSAAGNALQRGADKAIGFQNNAALAGVAKSASQSYFNKFVSPS
jgi:hypothetical protein